MSLNISGGSNVSYNQFLPSGTNTQTASTSSTSTSLGSDSLAISTTASTTPFPTQAGTWTKLKNSVGELFSDMADSMKFGETYKLTKQEFHQVDVNKDQMLDQGEFNLATLNLMDFFGTEFARADRNRDSRVDVDEYAKYRKEQLENVFTRRDLNGDKHHNVNEIGFIGQQLLMNRDVRIDPNQDGLVNKREFVRGSLQGMLNIRDLLGF